MAILLKNDSIFLHIPKTGGNFVTTCLRDLNIVNKETYNKHYDLEHLFLPPSVQADGKKKFIRYALRQIFSPFPRQVKKPFTFCFVRNPISWYESWYKYMSQDSRRWKYWGDNNDLNQWHPNSPLNGLGDDNFNQMIKNILNNRPGYVSEMYSLYTNRGVDFIGKQENLVEDLIKVLSIMGIDFDTNHIRNYGKVGVSPNKEIIWDDDLKKQIILSEYSAFKRYGYEETLDELKLGC